jgi:hypothetical protein
MSTWGLGACLSIIELSRNLMERGRHELWKLSRKNTLLSTLSLVWMTNKSVPITSTNDALESIELLTRHAVLVEVGEITDGLGDTIILFYVDEDQLRASSAHRADSTGNDKAIVELGSTII